MEDFALIFGYRRCNNLCPAFPRDAEEEIWEKLGGDVGKIQDLQLCVTGAEGGQFVDRRQT